MVWDRSVSRVGPTAAWNPIYYFGPDGLPVGGVQQLRLPWFSRKMYVYLRVSGVSLSALRGGLGWWRVATGVNYS